MFEPWMEKAEEDFLLYCKSSSVGVFSYFKIPKNLQDFLSHRIFRRIHGALNIDKKITNYTVWL
jgi:hypothetical protein